MISFEEFASLLPKADEQMPIAVDWVKRPAVNRYFVPPNLELESSKGEDSPIILISAPGAVGKTTFGEAVAHRRGAPIFDLSKRRVGTDTFFGLIENAFGFEKVAKIYQELKAGRFSMLLDAFDETKIGSGQANFEGFLGDIARHFRNHRSAPSVVLLARVDTADLIATAFDLNDVAYKRFTLCLFDESAARQFIEKYLDARYDEKGKPRAHRKQEGPFESVRNRLFQLVRSAVSDANAIDLLGYAPVLVALAEWLYEEGDYNRLLHSLEGFGSERAWNLLAAIAEDLLKREQQQKFIKQLPAELQKAVPDALSPGEQCFWLLLESVGMQTRLSTPPTVPIQLLSSYEDAAENQMSDHPFRSGRGVFQHVVFREYVLAWFLARFPKNQRELHDEIRGRLLSQMAEALPTPLLGRFALGLGPVVDGKRIAPTIAGRDLGFLYESFVAQSDKQRKAWLLLDAIEGSTIQGAIGVGEKEVHAEALQIEDAGAGLWFWRRLEYSQLHITGQIELGVQGGEFTLGPEVDIECGEFICPARQLFVRAPREEEAVSIDATGFNGQSQPQIKTDGDYFAIRCPTLTYPWVRYAPTTTAFEAAAPAMLDAFTRLARILKRLRARGYGELARHRDIIDIATGGTSIGRDVLQYCIDEGVIAKDGELFVMNDARAAQFGINWTDLRLRQLNDRIRNFLGRFLQRRIGRGG